MATARFARGDRVSICFLVGALVSGAPVLFAEPIEVEVGPNTGLKSYTWRHQGISLRLVQRLPDQTRAYLIARGFTPEAADLVARNCLFGSMFRNDGDQPLDFDLNHWTVVHDGQRSSLVTRERWAERLADLGLPKAARIAFNWSLLPTRQHFEPGDYNWGMTSYGLPPGSRFDLHLRLEVAGKPLEATLPDLECAPEKLK